MRRGESQKQVLRGMLLTCGLASFEKSMDLYSKVWCIYICIVSRFVFLSSHTRAHPTTPTPTRDYEQEICELLCYSHVSNLPAGASCTRTSKAARRSQTRTLHIFTTRTNENNPAVTCERVVNGFKLALLSKTTRIPANIMARIGIYFWMSALFFVDGRNLSLQLLWLWMQVLFKFTIHSRNLKFWTTQIAEESVPETATFMYLSYASTLKDTHGPTAVSYCLWHWK